MKRLIAAFALFACAAVASAELSSRYMAGVRRIVSTDTVTIPGSVITHYRQGTTEWATTNALRVVNVTPVHRYSKLKLIVAAKAAGRWDALKAGIKAADLEDEWLACQYVEDGDPSFVAATNAVVAAGIATAEEIAAFLEGARDN